METTDLDRYKQRLLDTRTRLSAETERLTENLRETAVSAGELSNAPTHIADRDAEGLDAEIALQKNEREILDQVERALERIEKGTFGVCEECGRTIARKRLDVIPYTPYCIDCSQAHETRP